MNDAAVTCYNQEGKPYSTRVHLVRKITIPGWTEMCVEGLLKMDPAHSLGVVESDWKTTGLLTAPNWTRFLWNGISKPPYDS